MQTAAAWLQIWRFGRLHFCLRDVQCCVSKPRIWISWQGNMFDGFYSRRRERRWLEGFFRLWIEACSMTRTIDIHLKPRDLKARQWACKDHNSCGKSWKCSTTSWQISFVSRVDRLCIDGWNVVDHHQESSRMRTFRETEICVDRRICRGY